MAPTAGGETVKAAGTDRGGADEGAAKSGTPAAGQSSPAKPAGAAGCDAHLGEFLGRMDDLRQSLLAGLSYSEYVVRVRAVRAAYEAVPVDRLGVACLAGPAGDAEDAFNQYLRAANAWGECAATAGCSASEVEGRLQRRWRIASKNLDAAEGRS
ncbi:MAG TPA: hypothetical protein VGI17_13445 [Solirubrobacterales bacterium]|jgi:hypothetical protein